MPLDPKQCIYRFRLLINFLLLLIATQTYIFTQSCLTQSSMRNAQPQFRLRLLTFWYNARVHECSQGEIGQHEKCDDTLIGRNPWMWKYVILASENKQINN